MYDELKIFLTNKNDEIPLPLRRIGEISELKLTISDPREVSQVSLKLYTNSDNKDKYIDLKLITPKGFQHYRNEFQEMVCGKMEVLDDGGVFLKNQTSLFWVGDLENLFKDVICLKDLWTAIELTGKYAPSTFIDNLFTLKSVRLVREDDFETSVHIGIAHSPVENLSSALSLISFLCPNHYSYTYKFRVDSDQIVDRVRFFDTTESSIYIKGGTGKEEDIFTRTVMQEIETPFILSKSPDIKNFGISGKITFIEKSETSLDTNLVIKTEDSQESIFIPIEFAGDYEQTFFVAETVTFKKANLANKKIVAIGVQCDYKYGEVLILLKFRLTKLWQIPEKKYESGTN